MTDAEYGEKTEISGIIEKITYCNKQNGYTVCTVKSGREHITVVGSLPFVTVGDNIKFIGSYTVHP